MKNIHLIPTGKPSRLHLGNSGLVLCDLNFCSDTINGQNIYITNDEKPKSEDWCLSKLNEVVKLGKKFTTSLYKKIILTTDQNLIKDGVQAISDEFLELFVKNLNCESIEVCKNPFYEESNYEHYKIITPKEEPKQKKDLAYWKANAEEDYIKVPISVLRYITELEERMYSEEEVYDILVEHTIELFKKESKTLNEWFEKFKKK